MLSPRPRHRFGMAGIAVIALLGMPTAAIAVDSNAVQNFKHYVECLGWLLTDLATHEANCTPSRPFEFPEQPKGPGAPEVIRLLSPSAFSEEAPPSEGPSESEQPSESEPPCIEPYYSCEQL